MPLDTWHRPRHIPGTPKPGGRGRYRGRAYPSAYAQRLRPQLCKVLAAVIPKAVLTSRVRCGECRHFERDTVGDGAGIGLCRIGGAQTEPKYPALWARAERECKDFKSREGAADAAALDPIEVRLLGADAIML